MARRKWKRYEQAKGKLIKKQLSHTEYEKEIKAMVKRKKL